MDQLPEIDDMTSYLAFGLFGDHEAWRESPLADIGPQSIGQEVLAFDPFPDASPWDKIFLPLMEPSFDQFLDTSSWDKMPLPPMGSQSIGEEVLAFDPFPDASLWGNMLLPVESPISNSSSILTGGNINLASEADYATGTDTKASTTLCSVPPSIGFLSKANLTIDAFPERKSRITSTIATPGTFLLGSESLPTAALVFDPESEYGFSLSDVSDEVADPKTSKCTRSHHLLSRLTDSQPDNGS